MFLGVATFMLVVFLIQLVVSLHNDVSGLRDVLATKEDLTNLAMTIGPPDPVEAALTYMKCAHCHTIDRIRELAIMGPEQRWEVILAMMKEPGAKISQEDARRIRDFYGEFWGWHAQ